MLLDLPELKGRSNSEIAGILARAALDIESGGLNPAAGYLRAGERELRQALMERAADEIRDTSGKKVVEPQAIFDLLEAEAEAIEHFDDAEQRAALERLSKAAVLPGDSYGFVFSPMFGQVGTEESERAEETIRYPDYQQDYTDHGEKRSDGQPSLISLFAKWYGDADNRYLFLVGAQKQEPLVPLQLLVGFGFRLYARRVPLLGAPSLVDALTRFVGVYGWPIRVGSWSGKWLLHGYATDAAIQPGERFQFQPEPSKSGDLKFSGNAFVRRAKDGRVELAFCFGVNMTKYLKDVARFNRR